MCEPISATTMMYISIASTAVSLYAQSESAKAQSAQIQNQADHEREEIGDAAEEELGQRIRASRERRARARVAAGESGALGASFAASINQSLSDENMDAALISKKSAFSQLGVSDREATALSQIRSPSALEAGLQIANAGISGYQTGLGIEALRDAAPKTTSFIPAPATTQSISQGTAAADLANSRPQVGMNA